LVLTGKLRRINIPVNIIIRNNILDSFLFIGKSPIKVS